MAEDERRDAQPADEAVKADPVREAAPTPEQVADWREKASLADEYFERLARTQADFENYRKRVRQEREELAAFAAERLVRGLLPILDNLERARDASDTADHAAWRQGVEITIRQFQDLLAKEGVEPIEAVGKPFDPRQHEAIMQAESESQEGTVLEEFQKGYRLGERVLRPSLVKVAGRPVN